MAYREVEVVEIREILRRWESGQGYRRIADQAGVDRKTVRRYVEAAQRAGLIRGAGEEQLDDGLVGQVLDAVQGRATVERGAAWRTCEAQRGSLDAWLRDGLRLTKVNELLDRQVGQHVPYRTLHRFAVEELGFGRQRATVRVADGPPGQEVQADFGELGFVSEAGEAKRRKVWALIFTAVYSRHLFVWPTYGQSIEEVVEGFERAWAFFGGVFRTVIIDNLKAVVDRADRGEGPRLNRIFLEYAQERGFFVDPARVRHPDDKPRVERSVDYVRGAFFAGEEFSGLEDVRRRAERWCRDVAGMRCHGTTRRRPLEVFTAEERPILLPAPAEPYDVPQWLRVKVHRDQHICAGKALYSVPTGWLGQEVDVRLDRTFVRIYHRGQLLKSHLRVPPGGRQTDPADYPPHLAEVALRDGAALQRKAGEAGPAVGTYAQRLLEGPLPWSRMRHMYRLAGLVRRYGAERVNAACQQALELDVVDVHRIARMLERALEEQPRAASAPLSAAGARILPFRFARAAEDFTVLGRRPSPQRGGEPDVDAPC